MSEIITDYYAIGEDSYFSDLIVKTQNGWVTVLTKGTISDSVATEYGTIEIMKGGVFSNATVTDGGTIEIRNEGVLSSGLATNGGMILVEFDTEFSNVPGSIRNVSATKSGYVWVNGSATGLTAANGGSFDIVDLGKLNKATILDGGIGNVKNGASAVEVTVNQGGKFFVLEGGTARDLTVAAGGILDVSSGKLTGAIMFEAGAVVSAEEGAILDFDLTQAKAGAKETLVNNLSIIKGTPKYTLTVNGTQENGVYKLAEGAAGFDKAISVVNTSGKKLGTLTVGGNAKTFGDHSYKLAQDGSLLTVTVGDPLPQNGPSEPLNDTLYINKTTVNTDVTEAYGTYLTAPGDPVSLDQFGLLEETITINDVSYTFCNHVEKKAGDDSDNIDYAKIVLTHGAKLSFHAEATAAATFTVYSLSQDKKGKYTLKSLQTLKLAKDKDGVFKADSQKTVDLQAAGDYYVSMKFTDRNAAEAYYNVSLNGADKGVAFYDLGNNTDDWTDMKTKGYGGAVSNLGKITASGDLIKDEWVGFGDKADYKKFTLESAAELSFAVNTSLDKGPLKLTICKLKETVKKSDTTYSQVTVKTITVKSGRDSAQLNNLRLAAGGYYFKVESTNVKKSTGYGVRITDSDFYKDVDDGWNNVLLNGKALNENTAYFYDNKLSVSGAIYLDKSGNYKKNSIAAQYTYEGKKYGGFVCFGDETDFAKLTLTGTLDVTFSLSATNDATLEIIKVTQKGEKNSKKSLQTIKFKAGNDPATSKRPLTLEVKDGVSYYVSVKATNVKKTSVDPRTYYNVSYAVVQKETSALAMPETDDLAMLDSLSFGQYAASDALADASAASLADLDGKSAWKSLLA